MLTHSFCWSPSKSSGLTVLPLLITYCHLEVAYCRCPSTYYWECLSLLYSHSMVQSQHGQLIHVNSVDMLTTCSLKEDGVTVSELFVNGISAASCGCLIWWSALLFHLNLTKDFEFSAFLFKLRTWAWMNFCNSLIQHLGKRSQYPQRKRDTLSVAATLIVNSAILQQTNSKSGPHEM